MLNAHFQHLLRQQTPTEVGNIQIGAFVDPWAEDDWSNKAYEPNILSRFYAAQTYGRFDGNPALMGNIANVRMPKRLHLKGKTERTLARGPQKASETLVKALDKFNEWAADMRIPVGKSWGASDPDEPEYYSGMGAMFHLPSENDQVEAESEARRIAQKLGVFYRVEAGEDYWFLVYFSDTPSSLVITKPDMDPDESTSGFDGTGALKDFFKKNPAKQRNRILKKIAKLQKQLEELGDEDDDADGVGDLVGMDYTIQRIKPAPKQHTRAPVSHKKHRSAGKQIKRWVKKAKNVFMKPFTKVTNKARSKSQHLTRPLTTRSLTRPTTTSQYLKRPAGAPIGYRGTAFKRPFAPRKAPWRPITTPVGPALVKRRVPLPIRYGYAPYAGPRVIEKVVTPVYGEDYGDEQSDTAAFLEALTAQYKAREAEALAYGDEEQPEGYEDEQYEGEQYEYEQPQGDDGYYYDDGTVVQTTMGPAISGMVRVGGFATAPRIGAYGDADPALMLQGAPVRRGSFRGKY